MCAGRLLSSATSSARSPGDSPAAQLRKTLTSEEKVVRARVDPYKVDAMHCETRDEAFTRDDWLFELKLDGYRLIASKSRSWSRIPCD